MAGKTALEEHFTEEDLDAISEVVSREEAQTSGEICVRIVNKAEAPIRAFAEGLFLADGLDKTDERSAVLILLALEDRRIEIVADEGIDRRVTQDVWDGILAHLAEGMAGEGADRDAVIHAVEEVGAVLREQFPAGSENANELPDSPELR